MAKMPDISLDMIEINSSEDFTNAVKVLATSLAKNTRTMPKSIHLEWMQERYGGGIIVSVSMNTERGM